jgi:hypothetical protein
VKFSGVDTVAVVGRESYYAVLDRGESGGDDREESLVTKGSEARVDTYWPWGPGTQRRQSEPEQDDIGDPEVGEQSTRVDTGWPGGSDTQRRCDVHRQTELVEDRKGRVSKIREVRVNTVLRTKKPKAGKGGYRKVVTAVPKVAGDNLTFIKGSLTREDTPGWMQVDPGSDVTCVLADYVASLGLQHRLVRRDSSEVVRVRGIGTEEGEGEIITHDIWMSWRVRGKVVDEWVTESLTPVEGDDVDMLVEGWCAVLSEMSVPMLLGGGHHTTVRCSRQTTGQTGSAR